MKSFYLNEDNKLMKLPVRYSDKLTEKIEEIIFYNSFEKENLKQFLNDLKGIVNWMSNPVIAWDNNDDFIHYDNEETYIGKYGILFKVLTDRDERGIERNFVYVIDIILAPRDYNLNVPSNIDENKHYITTKDTRNKVILTEGQLHEVIKETVRRILTEIERNIYI